MADYGAESDIGARIRAARKARGFMSIPALADAIEGGEPSAAILANIESGRKVDLNVVQLLNIAMALRVPLSYLLAPMLRPNDGLDLPGLSKAFDQMTAAEFDAWLSATPDSDYRADTAAERNDRAELRALRELSMLEREIHRQSVVTELTEDFPDRIEGLRKQKRDLIGYLRSAGWSVDAED